MTTICEKRSVFALGNVLPQCTREATQRLDIEFMRGASKGKTATVDVCDPCANLLRLTTGLKVTVAVPEVCADCAEPLEGHCSNCGECSCEGWCDDCGEYRCEPDCTCDDWSDE